ITTDKDAYSGFERTNLESLLKRSGVDKLVVCGLATDYCVKATILDGLKAGFEVTVVKNGIKGVNVQPGDSENAIEVMKRVGAIFYSI
ncbi:MAG: isochorismatase family protein, partial [Nitrosopumilus sp.]